MNPETLNGRQTSTLPSRLPTEQAAKQGRSPRWPLAILLIGGLLTLWLQVYSRNGVLFSGDGGLKALLAQQLGSGNLSLDLQLPAEPWVQTLWQQGLYPFTPPYVYEQGAQRFITFPFTFPAVTAPFYALMGYRGLYVVPLVALWAIWGRLYQICQRRSLPPLVTALGLTAVVVASPLLPYGAMYWEHTLAVALAFWGATGVLYPKSETPTLRSLAINGGLIGLAVWFRPEFLCLIAALGAVAILGQLTQLWGFRLGMGKTAVLIGAMGGTVLLFFALNIQVYGHPLGIHAIQIVEESSPAQQLEQAKESYAQLTTALFRYFPLIVLAIAAPFIGLVNSDFKLPANAKVLLLVGLLYAASVPLIVPPGAGGKQWGPRFYLILIPLAALVIAQQLGSLVSHRRLTRRVALGVFALMLAVGIHMNTIQGGLRVYEDRQTQSVSLAKNYEPIAPMVQALDQQPLPWVAMSHQFVAQQLWPSLPDKTFFLTETTDALKQLGTALQQQGKAEFLYVCYPHRDCPVPELAPSELQIVSAEQATQTDQVTQMQFALLGTFGKYPTYQVTLQSNDQSN
ncbi:MAG: dolichol-phosphate mannosyltransferase [Cyanobacteria bacterium P01_A01_bin.114]